MLTACVGLTVLAGGEETLTFLKVNGSTVSFSTDGLVITFDDYAHAIVNNKEASVTFDLDDLNCMYFGEMEIIPTGDVNGDGEVGIADVNTVIDIISGGNADDDTRSRADVNGDGEVGIADVNAILDIILNT